VKHCCICGQLAAKGYHLNPKTGQASDDFWCDDCYEGKLGKESQEKEWSIKRAEKNYFRGNRPRKQDKGR
jgi:hypothetical protein